MLRRGCITTAAFVILLLAMTASWFVWRASDASLPPLAKGMTSRFDEGNRQFKRRIEQRYPLGSSEDRLVSDLKSQGFDVTLRPNSLSEGVLSRFIGCGDKQWSVRWYADTGKLKKVYAVYGAICL